MDIKGLAKRVLMIGDKPVVTRLEPLGPQPSVLERLAQKIEPKAGERPEAKSQARLIKRLANIPQGQKIMANRDRTVAPLPTNAVLASVDQRDVYRFFDDGSLRGVQRKPTREERNTRKKARRHELRFTGKARP